LNGTIEDLEEAVECNIKKLLKIFEENPAYFLSERDVKCYLYSLLINDERIKKLSPLIRSGDGLNRDSRTLLVHAERPRVKGSRVKGFPQHDIFILPRCETASFDSLKPVIGIEIKFNRGPYRVDRKTPTPVDKDIEKLHKNKELRRRYLLWLNWDRPINEDCFKMIKKRYKNENVKIFNYFAYKKRNDQGEKIMHEVFKEMFAKLDELIHDNYTNFEELRNIYHEFLEYLKEKVGTSGGFTGLSEYIILKAIQIRLEQKHGKFEWKKKTNDAYFSISKNNKILLTHAISIDDNMKRAVEKWGYSIEWSEDKAKLRPDIVIFKLTNSHYKPEVIIQIKIYHISPKAVDDEVEKIKRMAGGGDKIPLCVIILFHQVGEHKQKLKEGFDLVITPEDPAEFKDMLQKIEERLLITSFIK